MKPLINAAGIIALYFLLFTSYRIASNYPAIDKSMPPDTSIRFDLGHPDIYFIILDEFASTKQLKDYYHVETNDFERQLVGLGFYVATESRSRFASTHMSLASSFTMGEYENGEDSFIAIRKNPLVKRLSNDGYKYFHIGSWLSHSMSSSMADSVINPYLIRNELFTKMIAASIFRLWNDLKSGDQSYVLNQFEALDIVRSQTSPKFVFAHIICPHAPFIFGPHGEPIKKDDANNWENKQFYVDQYFYIAEKTLDVITHILQYSKTPPIIIVQSDHGMRQDANHARNIFNAYYIPNDSARSQLTPDFSPDNTFKLIFNNYFGSHFVFRE